MPKQPAESAVNPVVDPAVTSPRGRLRREKIAMRQAMPPDAHRLASIRILDHLAQLLVPRPAGTLAFCWPIRGEIDCRPLAIRLIATGWRVAMPTVVATDAAMEFRAWSPGAAMTADPFGIPVPATTQTCRPDVILLPLVAFDAAGYRLGYGGGYFDRTLAALVPEPLTIGVGLECAAVASIEPGPHDIPLSAVVTEAGIRNFSPS